MILTFLHTITVDGDSEQSRRVRRPVGVGQDRSHHCYPEHAEITSQTNHAGEGWFVTIPERGEYSVLLSV